ncbi:MAG: hypothetical protein JRF37_05500 [Deltaproteobacteria bacterium]|nr:hypothetical protein [Deltaproteobacteria bacterium]
MSRKNTLERMILRHLGSFVIFKKKRINRGMQLPHNMSKWPSKCPKKFGEKAKITPPRNDGTVLFVRYLTSAKQPSPLSTKAQITKMLYVVTLLKKREKGIETTPIIGA